MIDMFTYAAARKYTDIKTAGIQPDPTIFKFKGIKEYITDLPLSGLTGDVWHVNEDNNEYVWFEQHWEAFGGLVDLNNYFTKTEIRDITDNEFIFTSALPRSSIDAKAIYFVPNTSLFPDTRSYVDNTWKTLIVATDPTEGTRMVRLNSNDGYLYAYPGMGSGRDYNWEIYTISDDSWVKADEGTSNNQWHTKMNFASGTDYLNNVIYSTKVIKRTNYWGEETTKYNTTDNIAYDTGAAIDTSSLDPFSFKTYKYYDNIWKSLGLSNFGTLFTSIASKAEVAEKFDIDDVVQTTGDNTDKVMSQDAVTSELLNKLDKPLVFTNKAVATTDWIDNTTNPDTGYEDYEYKAAITCTGVTNTMLAEVIFYDEQRESSDYSGSCETNTDTVTIYSHKNEAITIPTIIVGMPVVNINMTGNGHNYSTEEQLVGSWIDGKPLYEKVVVIENWAISSTLQNFAHNIDNLKFGYVENAIAIRNSMADTSTLDSSTKNFTNSYVYGLIATSSAVRTMIFGIDSTNIKIRHTGDNDSTQAYDLAVIIKYTKTTD